MTDEDNELLVEVAEGMAEYIQQRRAEHLKDYAVVAGKMLYARELKGRDPLEVAGEAFNVPDKRVALERLLDMLDDDEVVSVMISVQREPAFTALWSELGKGPDTY